MGCFRRNGFCRGLSCELWSLGAYDDGPPFQSDSSSAGGPKIWEGPGS